MTDKQIENFLIEKKFIITDMEFFDILISSPQIISQNHDKIKDIFHLWTEDGKHFIFKVKS